MIHLSEISDLRQLTRSLSNNINTVMVISSILLLSACSQGKSVNSLQKDFDQHTYSDYVLANLNAKTPTVIPKSNNVEIPKINLQKRLPQARINSESIVADNGLFKPNREQSTVEILAKKAPLNSLLNIALKQNLEIKSSKQRLQASLKKYNQVEFLSDTLKQYAAFTKDISLTGSAKSSVKRDSVAYPAPGLNAIKSSIIDESVKYSRLKLKQTTQDVITDVRIAYAELQTVKKETALLKDLTRQHRLLKQELQNNYETNTGDLSAILQADIDIASSENQQRLVENKHVAYQANMKNLLNLPLSTRFGDLDKLTKVKLSTELNIFKDKAHKNRVEIELLQAELTKMSQVIKLSEKRLYTDLDAGFSRTKNGEFTTSPQSKKNNFFAKNDAYLEETRQKMAALISQIAALKNNTITNLQMNLSAYESQQSTYKLYQNIIIPKAKASLDIANNSFEAGDGDNVKIIKGKVAIIKYRLLLLKALREMQINYNKMERLIGFKIE